MAGRSLEARLIALSMLWIVLALGAAAFVLAGLYRGHVERENSERIGAYLDELSAALDVTADGALVMQRDLSDPLFRRPYSGLYWQVSVGGSTVLRSRSLWDGTLWDGALDVPGAAGVEADPAAVDGPEGQKLTAWTRSIRYPDFAQPIVLRVAADSARIDQMATSFSRTLLVSLALLALGLIAAVLAQVRFGLAPLHRLGRAMTQLREGQVDRVDGEYPSEIRPLVEDLNAVLHENRELLARARAQAGNLAHALKTPLAVINNSLEGLGSSPSAGTVGLEVEHMRQAIERHLVRARAGQTPVHGRHVPVGPALEDVARAIRRIHGDRVEIELLGQLDARFRGDAADLQEIAGNLLDNAAKWARSRVQATVATIGDRILLTIEDDGAGIAPERRAEAVQRGVRLDTSRPGSGLGLQIVDELCRIYGGTLELGSAALGGLSAKVSLPGR
jgi:signal transduction histidine kinase